MAENMDKIKQLQEFQSKLAEYAQRGKTIQGRIRQAEYDSRKGDLTLQEVSALPEDTPTYTAVGKAFVISTRNEVLSSLNEEITRANEEAGKLKSSYEYNQRQARETESVLREILESSPAIAREIAAGGKPL